MSATEIAQFTKELNSQSKAINSMLPAGMDSRRFMRTVVNSISTHPQSKKLLKADRQSLFNSCQKAAGDGLLIDGREATLVVFKDRKKGIDTVSYIPMVQGLIKLARNSGEISNIISELVYSNDSFKYRPGIDDQPLHEPNWFHDRGTPVGVYAVVTTKEGEKIVSVLPEKRIFAIAGTGHNADQYSPKKGLHFEEWWKKTAIKNVLKYSPKSSYLENSHYQDENNIYDMDSADTVESVIDVESEMTALEQMIVDSNSQDDLISLHHRILCLPQENQESLVNLWNERSIKIESLNVSDKDQTTGQDIA